MAPLSMRYSVMLIRVKKTSLCLTNDLQDKDLQSMAAPYGHIFWYFWCFFHPFLHLKGLVPNVCIFTEEWKPYRTESTWAYINDGRIFILVLAVPLRAHSRPFPWSESGTNSPSEGPLPGHLLQAQSVFVYPQNHSKSKSMFGTALGGKLQTIRRSDMGFLLAPSFFFLFSFPLSLSSHTSQQNVTEECFPLAAHRHVWRRAWPPLSAERVKMLMRILQSSEGLNKVFISCRLTFIYLFTRNVLPLSSIMSPDRACLVFSAAVRAAIVWAQIAALARQPPSLIIPSDYL